MTTPEPTPEAVEALARVIAPHAWTTHVGDEAIAMQERDQEWARGKARAVLAAGYVPFAKYAEVRDSEVDLSMALGRAQGENERLRAQVARVEALMASEITDVMEASVRAARDDVRCLDCNLRYGERQEYGCHWSGRGHSYDDGDLAAAEESERAAPVAYLTLKVAVLRAALDPESGS